MRTKSSTETKKIAVKLARKILARQPGKHATVVSLIGDLGAGKTTFVQGFAKGLKIKSHMVSPTFLIFRKYKIPYTLVASGYTLFYHVDAYRIKKIAELQHLKFQEILRDPQNIVIIEWADIIRKVIPKEAIWIKLLHGKVHGEREVVVNKRI